MAILRSLLSSNGSFSYRAMEKELFFEAVERPVITIPVFYTAVSILV